SRVRPRRARGWSRDHGARAHPGRGFDMPVDGGSAGGGRRVRGGGRAVTLDPVTLEVTRNALSGVAEEAGVALRRTAYSPNIKERVDCSTAIFDPRGE